MQTLSVVTTISVCNARRSRNPDWPEPPRHRSRRAVFPTRALPSTISMENIRATGTSSRLALERAKQLRLNRLTSTGDLQTQWHMFSPLRRLFLSVESSRPCSRHCPDDPLALPVRVRSFLYRLHQLLGFSAGGAEEGSFLAFEADRLEVGIDVIDRVMVGGGGGGRRGGGAPLPGPPLARKGGGSERKRWAGFGWGGECARWRGLEIEEGTNGTDVTHQAYRTYGGCQWRRLFDGDCVVAVRTSSLSRKRPFPSRSSPIA